MIEIICKICGKKILTYPSRIGRKKYCSPECEKKDKSIMFKGKGNPFYGKHHTKKTIEINRQKHIGKTNNLKGRNYEEYFGIERAKEIKKKMSKKKIISDESRQKMRDSKKGIIPWNKGKKGLQVAWNKNKSSKIKIKCDFCGKTIKKSKSKLRKHNFCNLKCNSKFKIGKNNPFFGKQHTKETIKKIKNSNFHRNNRGLNHNQWKGGISFEPYGIEFNKELKEQIRARDQYRCQQCFRHQDELYTKTGRRYKLHIHHIDYNKQNNKPENLVSLCSNCHMQTNFKRKDWINYFQGKVK